MNTILVCVLIAMAALVGYGWWLSRDRRQKTYAEYQQAQESYEKDMLAAARRTGKDSFVSGIHKRPELKSVRPLNAQDAAAQTQMAGFLQTQQPDPNLKTLMPQQPSRMKSFAEQQKVEKKTLVPQRDNIDPYDWAQPLNQFQRQELAGQISDLARPIIGGGGSFDGGGASGDWGQQTAAPAPTYTNDSSTSTSTDTGSSSGGGDSGGSSGGGD